MAESHYRSALADVEIVAEAGDGSSLNHLEECERHSVLSLRGQSAGMNAALAAANLGTPDMLRVARTHAGRVLRLGPDEWMVTVPHHRYGTLGADLRNHLQGQHASLVDISERNAIVSLTGPQSTLILAAACPLDLHPAATPEDFASRTLFGKAEIVLERGPHVETFRLHCGRSFAPYVWQLLLEAGREFRLSASRERQIREAG